LRRFVRGSGAWRRKGVKSAVDCFALK